MPADKSTPSPLASPTPLPPGVEGISAATGGSQAVAGSGTRPVRRSSYPAVVDRLMEQLSRLPGVGRRSAERLAFHILKSAPQDAMDLSRAIADVKLRVQHCGVCWNLTDHVGESPRCDICSDPVRERGSVLVVEQPKDLIALEQTGMYKGLYHVLMGRISPLDGIGPEELTLSALLERIDSPAGNPGGIAVREVVLGLNPTVEGDGTALYLLEELGKRPSIRITRLARGLPTGSHLEFANKAVLADAIQCRQEYR